MFIIIREHERNQEVGCFFTEIFDEGRSFSLSFLCTMSKYASKHVHEKKWTSLQVHKEKVHNVRVSQVFSCVFCERNENREKWSFIVGVCQVRKAGKQRCTHFSSIFAQMQRHSMATVTNDGCSCCVVTLSQCWLQRY